jgi:hypothetical protein
MKYRRTIPMAGALAALLAFSAVGHAGALPAFGTVTTVATVKVSNVNADFGSGPHSDGVPTGRAVVTESITTEGISILLRGTLYVDRATAGCAGVEFTWKNAGEVVRTRQVNKCGPGGDPNLSTNQASIFEPLLDFADTLTVTTGIPNPGGFGLLKTRSVTVSV